MPAPLFDPDKCDNIGSVPSLDFDFVSDCSIAAPPPPIFDCTPPLVPREPPVPCPEFLQGSVHLQTGYAACGGPSSAGGALTVTQTDNSPCRFLIDLDLDIPIPPPPCPVIKDGSVTVTTGFENCVPSAGGTLTVTKTEVPPTCESPGTCEFTIDLDLNIPVPQPPCPVIQPGSVAVTTGYADEIGPPGGALNVTKTTTPGDCNTPDTCEFTIDLAVNVPVPRVPCPVITTTGTLTYDPTVAEPKIDFVVEPTTIPGAPGEADTCKFDINLDLELPVPGCPVINGVLNTYLTEPGETTGSITITPKSTTPGVCEFDLEIDIGIPRAPCPEFTAAGSVWINSEAASPQLTFTVEPASAGASQNCAFDFDLQLELPPPVKLPPCPVFTQRAVVLTTGTTPSAAIAIVPTQASDKEDGCDYAIDLGIKFPVPCQPVFKAGSTIITTPGQNEPTLTLGVTNPGANDCNYNLQFDWIFPAERPCPLITAPLPVSFAQSTTNNYSGQLSVTPVAPVGRGACQYELGLALYVPPPQTVCVPEVTVSGQVIVTPGRDEPVLKINTKTSGPSSCLNKDYEVYLELPPQTKVVEGEHNVTPGECGDDPTLALNIEKPEGTLNEYVVTIVGTIPDCSVCCPVESEVDIAPTTPTYPFMAAPLMAAPLTRPRMFLTSSSTARTFMTGDVIRFVVNFTTIRNRGAKPLEALQLEFSFDEEANVTRLADLVEPEPNVVATAFYFEYTVLEDDATCQLWINKIIDPRQVPYYSKLANSANRKVVVPFARKRIDATVNSGCSSASSSSSAPSSSSGDSSRFSSASSLRSSASSASGSSDSSSSVSSASRDSSSSSDSSRSSDSSDSSARSSDYSSTDSSNSSSSRSSLSADSSSSSGVSGSSIQSSASGASCPPAPNCPPCYYAFPAGYDGECVIYECLYVAGPDCPDVNSSSSSSRENSSSSDSNSSRGSSSAASVDSSSSSITSSSSSSYISNSSDSSSSDSSRGDSSSSSNSGPSDTPRMKWKCVPESSSSSSNSYDSSSSAQNSCEGAICQHVAVTGVGGLVWSVQTACPSGPENTCECVPPPDAPTTLGETRPSYCRTVSS